MYITFYKHKKQIQQITLFNTTSISEHYPETVTTINTPSARLIQNAQHIEENLITLIQIFNTQALPTLLQKPLTEQYYKFKIPKTSGGFREINAPEETLKNAQAYIVYLFTDVLKMPTHNAAFAYTKSRSIVDALKVHQKNKSHWFLKLDIKSFFPNCTKTLVKEKLSELYPIALFTEETKTKLFELLEICFLNNELPQGSPASPYLSNLLFTDFDYQITKFLNSDEMQCLIQKYVYTRYADDILISAKQSFTFQPIISKIEEIITPFHIKTEKTRYGSRAGKNWNLGLMLNKDNKITTGHVNKKNLKAMLFNFICRSRAEVPYSYTEATHLLGVISYAKQIEPEYITYLINTFSRKSNINIEQNLKQIIKDL